MKRRFQWIVPALVLMMCGASRADEPQKEAATPEESTPRMAVGEFVHPADSLSRLRYFDGDQVSLNDRCPVRKVRLNPKMPPVYVNGQPVGFC
jgi:hypothetical protein